MILAFTLSMPGCPSWNGRWSGESKVYAVTKSFSTTTGKAKAAEIAAKGYYSYGWSDGWRAGIQVRLVTPQEARVIRKNSNGFCGYEWMVQSIMNHGAIYADHEKPVVAQP